MQPQSPYISGTAVTQFFCSKEKLGSAGSKPPMKTFAFLCLLASFQSVWHLGLGDEFNKVEVAVVGLVDCFDCAAKEIYPHEAFSGIGVTVDCKGPDLQFKTRGVGLLNGEGKFWVLLPSEILENGNLKEECFVHLHSASATPCPPLGGIEATGLVFKSKIDEKYTFGPAGELKLSPVTCPSTFFLRPHFWHPKLPKFPPWEKFPPLSKHHNVLFDYLPHSLRKKKKKKNPLSPKIPIFEKPFPLPHPGTPSRKPLPPAAPKQEYPVNEHLPTTTPAARKPFYALPFPKRVHPISKVSPSRRLRIPSLHVHTHP